MRIDLLHRHHPRHADLRDAVLRRALRLLGRVTDRIEGLAVSVTDLNGPKGGIDRQCQVEAKLRDGRLLHVRARSSEIGKAIDAALRKLSRRIVCDQQRRNSLRRHARLPDDLALAFR